MNSIDSNISSRFSPYLTKSEDSKTHVPYFCLEAENPYYEQHKNCDNSFETLLFDSTTEEANGKMFRPEEVQDIISLLHWESQSHSQNYHDAQNESSFLNNFRGANCFDSPAHVFKNYEGPNRQNEGFNNSHAMKNILSPDMSPFQKHSDFQAFPNFQNYAGLNWQNEGFNHAPTMNNFLPPHISPFQTHSNGQIPRGYDASTTENSRREHEGSDDDGDSDISREDEKKQNKLQKMKLHGQIQIKKIKKEITEKQQRLKNSGLINNQKSDPVKSAKEREKAPYNFGKTAVGTYMIKLITKKGKYDNFLEMFSKNNQNFVHDFKEFCKTVKYRNNGDFKKAWESDDNMFAILKLVTKKFLQEDVGSWIDNRTKKVELREAYKECAEVYKDGIENMEDFNFSRFLKQNL